MSDKYYSRSLLIKIAVAFCQCSAFDGISKWGRMLDCWEAIMQFFETQVRAATPHY